MAQLRIFAVGLIFALLIVLPLSAQNVIVSFSAYAENDDYAVLEWNSGSEANLSYFRVERSLDGLVFIALADVQPEGDGTAYRYEDHELYKSGTRTYYYRIRAAMSNGTSLFSSVQAVTLAFSGIQQTWGSIKALFR